MSRIDKENNKFVNVGLNQEAVRIVGAYSGFLDGINYNEITFDYPSLTVEIINYLLNGINQRSLQITYTSSDKRDVSRVVII